MALIRVKDIVVKAKSSTVTAFNTAVTLSDDDAKLMIGAIKQMTSIVEHTGVGVGRRRRRDAQLRDLGSIEISALMDTADPDGMFALINGSYNAGAEFELEVVYVATGNKSIKANWLVNNFDADHTVVGDYAMVKANIDAAGTGFVSSL